MAMYGGNTPVTDESDDDQASHHSNSHHVTAGGGYTDEDDDINMNSNNAHNGTNYSDYGSGGGGGGFTETVLDEDDNNDGEAWDDNNNHNGGAAGMSAMNDMNNSHNNDEHENWVDIDYEGQSFRVPLTDKIRTFGDIKQYLLLQQNEHSMVNIEITSTHYIVDPETDHEYQDDDDALIANHKQLVIKWHCFFIKIVDGLDFREDIRVAEDFTIAKIKEQVEQDRNVRLDQLSKDGDELQNDKTLREYDIVDNGHTLISRICISILDQQCELSTDILVCEFWSIKDVLDVYLQSARRERHEKATLSLNDQVLDLKSTVYHENITNQCRLYYDVGRYKVLVYDSEMNQQNMYGNSMNNGDQQCVEIEVMDNQTIAEIQQEYARITRKPFMKNDKLLSNERQLEEAVPLFKLRIKDNEPLIIEREQQLKPAEYICAECGAIVSLRPYDAVQCRECFMNVVYKKRTNRVCQYNCR